MQVREDETTVLSAFRGGGALVDRRPGELAHFYRCIVDGQAPETPGHEGLEDVRLQIDIIKAVV